MTTPYRDDREALEERLAALQVELSRVRETLKALGDEQRTASDLEREIAAVRGQLDDRAKRTGLEAVHVAAPCNASWDAMKGDERVRFCPSCEKNVYNLSSLNRADAERLLAQHEGPPPCVRLYKRKDGTVITNDCPVGLKRRRLRRIVAASVGGTILAAGAMLLRWRASSSCAMVQGEMMVPVGTFSAPADDPPPMMGKIASRATATPSTSGFAEPPPRAPDASASASADPSPPDVRRPNRKVR